MNNKAFSLHEVRQINEEFVTLSDEGRRMMDTSVQNLETWTANE